MPSMTFSLRTIPIPDFVLRESPLCESLCDNLTGLLQSFTKPCRCARPRGLCLCYNATLWTVDCGPTRWSDDVGGAQRTGEGLVC